jgi:broad specificity phosphatase PhoE
VEAIAKRHVCESVLVVSHGGVIRALRRHAAGDPGESLANGATFALALVEGALVVHEP